MLELQNICYSADGKTILDNVSLQFNEGDVVAITGHNGSGKTTLARIVMGIYKPTSGKVIYNGTDITALSITERANLGISYAFQQPIAFKGVTVKDLLKASSGSEEMNMLCECLSRVGLCARNYIDRTFDSSLSGGEQKRIELATVLSRKGGLFLFDEPEAGIDLWSFDSLTALFKRDPKKIVVIISHQEKILRAADKIAVIDQAKLSAFDKSEVIVKTLCFNNVCDQLRIAEEV